MVFTLMQTRTVPWWRLFREIVGWVVLLNTAELFSIISGLWLWFLFIFFHRCWKALKSWTIVCCWESMFWIGRWGGEAAEETAGVRVGRRSCTPQPGSRFKETAKLPSLSLMAMTTREWNCSVFRVNRNKRCRKQFKLFCKLSPRALSPKIYLSKICRPTVHKIGVSTFLKRN